VDSAPDAVEWEQQARTRFDSPIKGQSLPSGQSELIVEAGPVVRRSSREGRNVPESTVISEIFGP